MIGPLVRENHVEVTSDRIKIRGMESEEYKYWIECGKIEEPLGVGEDESDPEEIERELVEEILVKVLGDFGIIPNQGLNYLDYTEYHNSIPDFLQAHRRYEFLNHGNLTNSKPCL